MLSNVLILGAVVATGALLMWPRLAQAPLWRAAITPLASIIGSGFLVLGPILNASYGWLAPLVMAMLCIVAYAFGYAVRYNIRTLGDDIARDPRPRFDQQLETAASWALALSYVISVAYYLNLFGAFGLSLTGVDDPFHARSLTTAVYVLILIVGWTRGFGALEQLEQISVGLKLTIIAGLLMGMALYTGRGVQAGALYWNPATLTGWPALALAFGLLVTVQGFETSRYLGAEYDAALRIKSMRLAQYVASAIYMIYIPLLAYAFAPNHETLSETAIIDMMRIVAPILPGLLIVAALSAQFSAAVADTGGMGGLLHELTHQRLSARQSYLVLVLCGLALTWAADVFAIISYASRAFALYYGLQAAIAMLAARRDGAGVLHVGGFAGLTILGVLIAIFSTSVE